MVFESGEARDARYLVLETRVMRDCTKIYCAQVDKIYQLVENFASDIKKMRQKEGQDEDADGEVEVVGRVLGVTLCMPTLDPKAARQLAHSRTIVRVPKLTPEEVKRLVRGGAAAAPVVSREDAEECGAAAVPVDHGDRSSQEQQFELGDVEFTVDEPFSAPAPATVAEVFNCNVVS